MANSLNLDIYRGANSNWRLFATDQAGNPLNLSGYNLSGSMLCNWGSSGILLNLNPTFYSDVSGIINIYLSGQTTSQLPVTQAVYSIFAMDGSGISLNFLRGYMNIYP